MSNLKPEAFYRRNLPHFVPPGACALPRGQAHPLAMRASGRLGGVQRDGGTSKVKAPAGVPM